MFRGKLGSERSAHRLGTARDTGILEKPPIVWFGHSGDQCRDGLVRMRIQEAFPHSDIGCATEVVSCG